MHAAPSPATVAPQTDSPKQRIGGLEDSPKFPKIPKRIGFPKIPQNPPKELEDSPKQRIGGRVATQTLLWLRHIAVHIFGSHDFVIRLLENKCSFEVLVQGNGWSSQASEC